MIAIDTDDLAAARARTRASRAKIFERLQDPWGELEARLLLAQVALARGRPRRARSSSRTASAIVLDEAEPRQHRHLTLAWLAQRQGRWPARPPRSTRRARRSLSPPPSDEGGTRGPRRARGRATTPPTC